MHRSFRNRAKAQLPAATTNSGPLPSPTRRTAGQASQRFKPWGVPPGSQVTGSPLSTRALRLTDLAPNHQGKEALPVATDSRWHPEAPLTLQAPPPPGAGPCSSLQLSGGPRKAPRPSIPGPLATRSTQGKARPAAQAAPCAAQRPHPNCWAEPCSCRGSSATRLRPVPPRPGHPKGVAQYRESLQAFPRLATSRFFGSRRRSAERNVLAPPS
ncbi:hypothetical protein NDU88_007084 [Pleurodeles waltl]|uniref:Uncharacterized protein n=1 Tax=Pleurodeles waltl TaxID=8319 RepID=A0AAV7TYP5_PLEWA|nr:hypothetical protein NDU88_007084 [Pleurodeles waltl]